MVADVVLAGVIKVLYVTRGCWILLLSIHKSLSDTFLSSQSVQIAFTLRSHQHFGR